MSDSEKLGARVSKLLHTSDKNVHSVCVCVFVLGCIPGLEWRYVSSQSQRCQDYPALISLLCPFSVAPGYQEENKPQR